jgi:hypothetical protein
MVDRLLGDFSRPSRRALRRRRRRRPRPRRRARTIPRRRPAPGSTPRTRPEGPEVLVADVGAVEVGQPAEDAVAVHRRVRSAEMSGAESNSSRLAVGDHRPHAGAPRVAVAVHQLRRAQDLHRLARCAYISVTCMCAIPVMCSLSCAELAGGLVERRARHGDPRPPPSDFSMYFATSCISAPHSGEVLVHHHRRERLRVAAVEDALVQHPALFRGAPLAAQLPEAYSFRRGTLGHVERADGPLEHQGVHQAEDPHRLAQDVHVSSAPAARMLLRATACSASDSKVSTSKFHEVVPRLRAASSGSLADPVRRLHRRLVGERHVLVVALRVLPPARRARPAASGSRPSPPSPRGEALRVDLAQLGEVLHQAGSEPSSVTRLRRATTAACGPPGLSDTSPTASASAMRWATGG